MPIDAAVVRCLSQPRWLRPLLPIFRTGEPLRVRVIGAKAPVWAWRLSSSLAAVFACVGARAGLQVREWQDGFAVGAPGFDRVPATPHVLVVAAECDPTSIGGSGRLIGSIEQERCFLVVHGDDPALEGPILLDATRVVRFPMIGSSELAALANGMPPGLTKGPFGRACFGLSQAIVTTYR